jgi:hypothetical protein
VNAHKVVVHEVDRDKIGVVLGLLKSHCSNRANRFFEVRMVRFWRPKKGESHPQARLIVGAFLSGVH